MRFLLLSAWLLTTYNTSHVLASNVADASLSPNPQIGMQAADLSPSGGATQHSQLKTLFTSKIFVASVLVLSTYLLNTSRSTDFSLYGGQTGNLKFKEASNSVVTQLTKDLSKTPFYSLKSFDQQKTWFLEFLENQGKQRKQIAKETRSPDSELFGTLRSSVDTKEAVPFGNSVVSNYPLMEERFFAYIRKMGVFEKKGNFIITNSPEIETQGKNFLVLKTINNRTQKHGITPESFLYGDTLEANNNQYKLFDLFLNNKTNRDNLLLNSVLFSLTRDAFKGYYRTDPSLKALRIIILQEYITIGRDKVPGRGFGLIYDPSDTTLKQAPLSLCHPLLFPHIKADKKKGDYLLDKTMNCFFEAVLKTKDPHYRIAEFIYYFAITMPYVRGSAAIGEWIYQALCNFRHIQPIVPEVFSHLDQLAQSSFTFEKFWTEYQKLIPA